MIKKRRQKPSWVKELALKRINRLFELAEQQLEAHPDRSRRYIELARKLSTRYNVTIPSELKMKFCKQCNSLLINEKTLKIERMEGKKYAVAVCLACGAQKKLFN